MTQTVQPRPAKTIVMAEHAGFCHGVKRALEQTLALVDDPDALSGLPEASPERPVYVLGELIHNRQVIDRLAERGIHTVTRLEDVPAGSRVVIRTHGAPPELVEAAEARQVEVSDATCPDVRLVQQKAIQLAEEGYTVVVVGRADHPEVIGITAHAERIPGARIIPINHPDELAEKLQGVPRRRIGVVSQTTQLEEAFFETVKRLARMTKELKAFNTICPATFYRQTAALDLSARVDLMVVIGGKHSSNTSHLADICREQGTPTLHIETAAELAEPDAVRLLAQGAVIGVTAGASTPDWVVQDVLAALETLEA